MDIKDDIRQMARAAGAWACGFAKAGPVNAEHWEGYRRWISRGENGTMDYCERYADVRRDPRLLLFTPQEMSCDPEATVISCAFCYNTSQRNPLIASYSLGYDYHYVLKQRLSWLSEEICARYGGKARVVVDSAPIMEKYWAMQSGIGFKGRNGMLIIPGAGSYFFLGEIVWSGVVRSDEPCRLSCGDCMRCQIACPGDAINGDGTIDARRCVSYLTIEHKGEIPTDAKLGGSIYGCDRCQMACPHNTKAPISDIPEFAPRPEMLSLDSDAIDNLSSSQYKKLVARSAMRRIPLRRLLSNLAANQSSDTAE